ncbi:AMP-binding protein [Streptomyces sp. NPDC059524]|uniref:AMP-binding protein n=1 Tax=Streptomyces sp. NPDC059524 TaxID=3346856 RepID=UPI00369257EF
MPRDETAATRAFRAARDVLLEHREDLDAARRAFTWPRPEHFNWALDWFDVLADGNTDPALRILGEAPDGTADTEVTYAQISRRSDQVAVWLRALGVHRGDHVLVVLHNRVEMWETLLAVMKLGAVVVPTYTTTTAGELADRIERADIRHVIAEAETVPRFAGIGGTWTRVVAGGTAPGWLSFDASHQAGDDFRPDAPTRADAPLFRYFTSGTTSRPKMVEHTHLSYPVGHLSGLYWNGVRPGDRHLNVSAPGWAKHAWSSFFVPWTAGATVLALATPRPGPRDVLTALRTRNVTTVCAPPTVWRGMVQEGLGARPPALREATAVGESLEPALFHTVHEAWQLQVRDGFGQTETTAQIGNPPGRRVEPGRMGWALPGYDLRVLDRETGHEVPDGTPGELCVRLSPAPAGMMTGYAGDTTRTDQAFRDGHYHTGDLVLRHPDGSYAYVGRTDDMFKSFDVRISPLELERALLRSAAVAQAAVVPVPHPVGLWQAKAYVVPARGHHPGAETARAVFAEVTRALPTEKWVRLLEFTTDLPLTASGKIRRAELRSRPRGGATVHECPVTEGAPR